MHHLVFETERHAAVFDDVAGSSLIEDFQIAQIRVLPDHCHLRVCLLPAMSVSECVLLLMNNSWAMMNRRFWGVLDHTGYAATIGDVTTAEVKAYLGSASY